MDYFNLFLIVGGVVLILFCYLYGMNYIVLKIEGLICECVWNYVEILYGVLYVGLVVFVVLMYFKMDFYEKNFVVILILMLVIVVLMVIVNVGVFKCNIGNDC